MKCNNCGSLIENDKNTCPNCLTAVQSNTQENNEKIEIVDLGEKKEQNSTNPKKENNNKKTTKIIYILIILLIITIIILSILLINMDKPRQVFKTGLDILKSEINQSFSIKRKPYQISYSIETELNEEDEVYGKLYEHINELTIDFDLFNNIEQNYLFFDLVTTYQYKNHINLIGLLDRNLFYLNSPADFKEYYAFDAYNNIFAGINRVTDQELLLIVDTLITTFNSVLKSEYFIEKQSIITLDEKQINTIIDTFIINETNYKEISKKIIKKLKRNTEFINAYAKYVNIDGVDIIGKLNRLSESIQIGEYKIPEIKLNLYMDTNQKLIGFGIEKNDKVYNVFIEENNLKIYEKFDKKIVDITKDEEKYLITFSGGKIKIKYKLIENPVFSKPIVVDNNVLYESLTQEEKTELSEKFLSTPVMKTFITDFDSFIKSIKINIDEILKPSKEKFRNEIYNIIEKSKTEKNNTESLSGNNVFTNEVTIPGNKLDIDKINSIYYVKLNEETRIKRLFYMNNLYCFDSDKIEKIDFLEKENIKDEHFVIRTKKDSYEECKSNFSLFN